jgi:uncharacterized protein
MKCPRCENASLDERERNGLNIDVCASCRGVWLDRGELEKLLALAKRELEEERAYYGAPAHAAPTPAQAAPPYRDYDREPPSSDRRHGYDRHGRPYYKKRSWLDNIGDIFD